MQHSVMKGKLSFLDLGRLPFSSKPLLLISLLRLPFGNTEKGRWIRLKISLDLGLLPSFWFTWIEFENGGHGVFMLTRDQLVECAEDFKLYKD